MGIYDRTFGKGGQARRAVKRAEQAEVMAKLYAPRLSPEENFALRYAQPTAETDAIGLPLFPGIMEIAQHSEEIKAAAEHSARFLRSVRLSAPINYSGTIKELLRIGDQQLEQIAQACGAAVIGHEYGLYDNRATMRRTSRPSFGVPSGFILAARVDAIKEVRQLDDNQVDHIEDMVAAYMTDRKPYKLCDLNPEQFIFGRVAMQEPRLYLADIDLRFA